MSALSGKSHETIGNSRHIECSFSLIDDDGASVKTPNNEEYTTLMRLFEGTTGIVSWDNFLEITVKTLPEKPWPLTVADVPLYLRTEDDDLPPAFTEGTLGRAEPVFREINARGSVTDEQLQTITAYFDKFHIGKIRAIRYAFSLWQILVTSDVQIVRMPKQIANLTALYSAVEDTLPHQIVETERPCHSR